MKQPIRYFSIGLLSSAVVLMLFFLFLDDEQAGIENTSVETLVNAVKAKGYHVLSEDEYISLSVAGKGTNEDSEKEAEAKDQDADGSTKEKESEKDEEKEPEKDKEEPAVVTFTLTVKPNMLGPEISQHLADNKIIEEPEKFNRYLEDEGYSRYIQLGDHTLTSDMSYYEIAEKITK